MIKMYIAAALLVAVVPAQAITELSDTSKIHDIDEVVIVSQPKEIYSLRRQAVSSTALGSNELSLLGVRDLREISSYVPSFVMPDYGSRYTSSIYIRGIGSRVNNPAVAIYSDGIPLMSKSAFNTHTYQLDRVDILCGPQGTLYGQNAEGGIIRLYSKNPMNYQGTDIKLSIGSHLWRNTEFATYKKFNNKFAMSLAGFYDGQNGFFRNVGTGERADKMNEAGGKLRFVYQPTSRLSLNFIADYQYVNQNGFPYGVLDKETGETASTNTTYQSKYRRNMFNAGFDLGFLGNYFDFHSVTSYQYLKDYMLMDQDYLPEDYMHLEQRQFQNAFTQDFSLKSIHPVGGFWHWTLGAFFSAQWLKTDGPVYFGDAMTSTIAKAMMTSPIITSCSVEMGAPGVYHTPQQNLAFYHESNFDITPRFVATLGLRFDYNHTKIEYLSSAYMRVMMTMNMRGVPVSIDKTVSTAYDGSDDNNLNQLLPKFGLRYNIDSKGSNVYATVSKGYRAGGFNIQMFSDILSTELNTKGQSSHGAGITHTEADYKNVNSTIAYKPEVSWNYEVGTHINLFDNIQFDFSAFYMQIRNQQLSVMAGNYGFGRMMVNAGKSYSCGIEAALRGRSFNNRLEWGVNYGLTHAAFKEYGDSIESSTGTMEYVDYKDKKVPYVPMHTFAAHADWHFDLNNGLLKSVIIGANVNASGKTYWDEANTYSQKFYAVLGAHADADFGCVKLSLWGRNITNTKYNTFAVQSSATGSAMTFAQLGNPVQVGMDLNIHF